MKHIKLLLTIVLIITSGFWGCSSNDPETPNNDEVTAAMNELDQLYATLSGTDAFNAISMMPTVELTNPDLVLNFPDNLNKALNKSRVVTESNPMDLLFYMFFPTGTYTYNGTRWTYDGLPDNEIIFDYTYTDETTGATHNVILRYYNFIITNTQINISIELDVDNTQVADVTIQMTGTGFDNITWNQDMEITSISVSGYVVDDMGTQYNFSFGVSQTQVTVMMGVEGQTPLYITITGDLMSDDMDSVQQVEISYGALTIVINEPNASEGEIGYITFNGTQVGVIIMINETPYIQWNDGTQTPFDTYFPNASNFGGEFI